VTTVSPQESQLQR
jgi:hypothetical protein